MEKDGVACETAEGALFTQEKSEIVVEIFGVACGRCNDQHRPAAFLSDQRENVGLRASLDSLDTFSSRPSALDKRFELGSKIKVVHVKKLKPCRGILGMEESGLPPASASFAHVSIDSLRSFIRTSR